jgi:4-hydroxy-2-oxoheptanedioate aldolase
VQRAIEDAITRIVKSGKAAGILTSDHALARRYLELGATFVATGVDVLLYANAARKLAAEFEHGPAVARPGAAY